jgi:hypothetical protein
LLFRETAKSWKRLGAVRYLLPGLGKDLFHAPELRFELLQKPFLAVADDRPVYKYDEGKKRNKKQREKPGIRRIEHENKQAKKRKNRHHNAQPGAAVFISNLVGKRRKGEHPSIHPRHHMMTTTRKTDEMVGKMNRRTFPPHTVAADDKQLAIDEFEKLFPVFGGDGMIAT